MTVSADPAIGLTLQPDRDYLERLYPLFESEVDLLEVAPETTWLHDPAAATLTPNSYHATFLAIGARCHKQFIAHGVGLSLGTTGDADRRDLWLTRLAADQQLFKYCWYTDHLGASALAGQAMTLPIGLPMTASSIATVRARLADMQSVVPTVGLENSAIYFTLGDPLAEPAFINAILKRDHHLLLDLHNLHTMAENFGFDPHAYLAALDLTRVLEIHLAGGRISDPAWLPSHRSLRLDSHDASVPEPVWRLLEHLIPRCPAVRAVVLERMEGTVEAGDEILLREELRRARRILRRSPRRASPETRCPSPCSAPHGPPLPPELPVTPAFEQLLAAALRDPDPVQALARLAEDPSISLELRAAVRHADPDGVRLSAMFIARLRFERLLQGDPAAAHDFDADPEAFTALFHRYHTAVPPTAFFPQDEAALFKRWRAT